VEEAGCALKSRFLNIMNPQAELGKNQESCGLLRAVSGISYLILALSQVEDHFYCYSNHRVLDH
jgi:hypothetical protein